MKTIHLLKGLPASGKSTWSKQQQIKEPNTVRVNKDELRAMLHNDVFSNGREDFTLKVRNFIVEEALRKGYHVIVDDTNFHPKHEEHMKQLAKANNAVVQVHFFDIPLEEAIARDAKRDKPVGANVITGMYDKYISHDISAIPTDKLWIISDTHFTHQMLLDEKVRPEDYNEQIINNWNAVVSEEDTVLHLGDVIFGYDKERLHGILLRLKGHKILVKGNHDLKPDKWYLDMGFEHVYDQVTWNNLLFTHIPVEIPEGVRFNVHGHLHGNSGHRVEEVAHILTDKHKLVALEITGYKPLRIEEIIRELL